MTQFLKAWKDLPNRESMTPCLVNVAHIFVILPSITGKHAIASLDDGSTVEIHQSLEEIITRLQSAQKREERSAFEMIFGR